MDQELLQIAEKVKEKVNKKRYIHTIGVTYTAAALAMRYDADIKKAALAGLLHDNAKCYSDEKMLEKCKKHEIKIRKIEKQNPYLLHAKLGACYAKCKYGIEDEEILDAITWHTTGKADMSLLEKIIFVADYMEPGRKMIEGLPEVRREAFLDLDKCVYLILRNTLQYLEQDKGKEIDEMTYSAYCFYEKEMGGTR